MDPKNLAWKMGTDLINAIWYGLNLGVTIPGTEDFKITIWMVVMFFSAIAVIFWAMTHFRNHR